MAPILAAAIWYEMVAWESTLSRELVQIGADVTAAGGAAWLAGGMNILALINVIMSFILTAFVVIRVVQILCLAAAIFFFGLSFVPFCQWALPLSQQATQFGTRAFQLEQRVGPRIMEALKRGTQAERMVARAFPYISTAMSATMAGGLRSGSVSAGAGAALNFSITPTALDRLVNGSIRVPNLRRGSSGAPRDPVLEVETFPERIGSIQDGQLPTNPRFLQRLSSIGGALPQNLVGSLPAEGEGYSAVCARAAGDWTNFSIINDLPFFDRLGQVLSFLGGNMTTLMCEPMSQAKDRLREQVTQEARDALENKATEVATASCEADRDAGRQTRGQRRHPNRSNSHQMRNCIRGRAGEWRGSDEGREFRDQYERDRNAEIDRTENAVAASTEEIETAKIWNLISSSAGTLESGANTRDLEPNLFLSSYSFFATQAARARWVGEVRSPIVRRLAGGDVPVPGVQLDSDRSSARGRFYFDCGGSSMGRANGADDIYNCSDNSLWRPGGWKWTLGLDRPPAAELGTTGIQAVSGYLGFITGNVLQGTLGAVMRPLLGRLDGTQVSGRGSHFTDFLQRLGATGARSNAPRFDSNHFLNWGIDGNTGSAIEAALRGETFEPDLYFR